MYLDWQTFVVLLLVALAACYVGRTLLRAARRRT